MELRWKQLKPGNTRMVLQYRDDDGAFKGVPLVGHDDSLLTEHPQDTHRREQREAKEKKAGKAKD